MIDSQTKLTVSSAGGLSLNCVLTLKAGSTFLRNLFYVLEHGALYHDPLMIHNFEQQTTRSLTKHELAEHISFFVVRNPIDRFFSLYFDKIISPEPHNFSWAVARMKKDRVFHDGENLTLEQHRENSVSLAWFVKFRLNMHRVDEVNPHWRPQIAVVRQALKFGLTPLLQENLSTQLLQIAGGRIEGLAEAIALVGQRNKSKRNVSANDILTPELKALICELYEDDMSLYKLLVEGWAHGQPPDLKFLVE